MKKKSTTYETGSDVLVIPEEVYRALNPIEQMMAQALQRVGSVKVLYDDPKFKNFNKKLTKCMHLKCESKMQRLYKREDGKFVPCAWLCPYCGQIQRD